MNSPFKSLRLGGALLTLWLGGAALAQTPEPALAPAWTYMQSAMPGVPYELLKAACQEGALMIYHGTWSDAQKAQVEQFRKRFPCITIQMFQLTPNPLRPPFVSHSPPALP